MSYLVTLCLCIVGLATSLAAPYDLGCRLEVDIDSLQFPLVWNNKGIIYPIHDESDSKWYIELNPGDAFNASCSTIENNFRSMNEHQLELQCVQNSIVKSQGGLKDFQNIRCSKDLQEVVTRNGTCYNNFTKVNIEFNTANPAYTLYTVCHDEETDETIYSVHELDGPNLENAESGGSRPSFKEADFYKNISADNCYKQVEQTNTIAELVGSRQLAEHYIQTSRNLFLARGHFTPNGDPIYAFQKRATFYFINASPQWQTINGGNFERLESATREIAKTLKATFTVWTGSYGVTTLKDVNNKSVEIWLGKDSNGNLLRKLPVAHLTWKVIHNQLHNTAIAVIHINNPWITNVSWDDILCTDVCDHISWIGWDTKDIVKGYTYCCDVDSFRKAVPYAPDLGHLPLLDYP